LSPQAFWFCRIYKEVHLIKWAGSCAHRNLRSWWGVASHTPATRRTRSHRSRRTWFRISLSLSCAAEIGVGYTIGKTECGIANTTFCLLPLTLTCLFGDRENCFQTKRTELRLIYLRPQSSFIHAYSYGSDKGAFKSRVRSESVVCTGTYMSGLCCSATWVPQSTASILGQLGANNLHTWQLTPVEQRDSTVQRVHPNAAPLSVYTHVNPIAWCVGIWLKNTIIRRNKTSSFNCQRERGRLSHLITRPFRWKLPDWTKTTPKTVSGFRKRKHNFPLLFLLPQRGRKQTHLRAFGN